MIKRNYNKIKKYFKADVPFWFKKNKKMFDFKKSLNITTLKRHVECSSPYNFLFYSVKI